MLCVAWPISLYLSGSEWVMEERQGEGYRGVDEEIWFPEEAGA